jgi:hypothetical protein
MSSAGTLPSSRPQYDVFLTHDWGTDDEGRSNHARVAALNTLLQQRGLRTWFDEERMSGHIVQQMCRGIDHARAVIVFVTRRYMTKVDADGDDNCKKEFNYAVMRHGTARMVPIVMEHSALDTRQWFGPLGMELGSHLYVRMTDEAEMTGAGLEGVMQKLAAMGIHPSPPSGPSAVTMPPPRPGLPQTAAASAPIPREVSFLDSDRDEIAFLITPEGIAKYVNKSYNKKVTAFVYRCSDGDLRDQDGWGGAVGHGDRDRVLAALKPMCESQRVMLRIVEPQSLATGHATAAAATPHEVSFFDSDNDEISFVATPGGLAKYVNKQYNKKITALVYRKTDGDLRDQDSWGGAIAAKDRSRVVDALMLMCKEHGVKLTVQGTSQPSSHPVSFRDSDNDHIEFRSMDGSLCKIVNGSFNKKVTTLRYKSGDLRDQHGWGGAIAPADQPRVTHGLAVLCAQHGVPFIKSS